MSAARVNSARAGVFIAFVIAFFVVWSPAVAQVGPVPPQPPIPARSEAKKPESETSDAKKSDEATSPTAKADDEKTNTTKPDAKKSDAGKRADEKKPDPVREWIHEIRNWSLPGFIAWLRDPGFYIVLILPLAS